MVQVRKERLTTAGRAWRTMPWAWAVEGSMAQEGGDAPEAVKEAPKAPEVDLVLTETTASKEETEENPLSTQT